MPKLDQSLVTDPNAILRLPEVMRRTGLSKTIVYRRMKRGEFPARFDLGGRAVGWRCADIDAWLRERGEVAAA